MVDDLTGLHYPTKCHNIMSDGKCFLREHDCICAKVRVMYEPLKPLPRYRILWRHLGQLVLLMQLNWMTEDGKEVIRWVEKFRFTQPPYFPDIKPQKP